MTTVVKAKYIPNDFGAYKFKVTLNILTNLILFFDSEELKNNQL